MFDFAVFDREVDRARAAVGGDKQKALASLAVGDLQFWKMLDVDVTKPRP